MTYSEVLLYRLHVQPLKVEITDHLFSFFKFWTNSQEACVFATDPSSKDLNLVFLQDHIDRLLHQHLSKKFLIVGDLNEYLQYLVARSSGVLLDTFGLVSHVDFPTHTSGSSLDLVITDLLDGAGTGHPGKKFAHLATLPSLPGSTSEVCRRKLLHSQYGTRAAATGKAFVKQWSNILDGDVDDRTLVLTRHLVTLQSAFEPHEDYKARSMDQP